MRTRLALVEGLLVFSALLLSPLSAHAQEASFLGTVSDTTGAVLPGVVVRAVNDASGNSFETVTDSSGSYRLAVRIGTDTIAAELSGFAPLMRTGVQVLVGQQVVINLQMAPATLQESVTVTGEAPLINTTTSMLAANIDSRQMENLPVNGRNWMDLAMLAPGSRQNESAGIPSTREGYAQINVDGQQVTVNFVGSAGIDQQDRFSRDAIAEFELISNRFDATQGRSAGMQVNAVTKSGTNVFAGTLASYFRDDKFNSEDFIQKRVLPYSNEQVSTTFGGPIRRDRIHFFGNYEFEREPNTITFDGPYPAFNIDFANTRWQHSGGGKVDTQFSPKSRLSTRVQVYRQHYYAGGGSTNHPSSTSDETRESLQAQGTWTRVFGTRAINELKVGTSRFNWETRAVTNWAGGDFPNAKTYSLFQGVQTRVTIRGYTFGGSSPRHHEQIKHSVRDDFSFTARGHALKVGGEYIPALGILRGCGGTCRPTLVAQNGAPSYELLQRAFPVWNDAATWNLNLLTPFTQRYDAAVTSVSGFYREMPQKNFASWVQDDWRVNSRLTLNLGLRWDLQTGDGAAFVMPPFFPGNLPEDKNNLAPRFGFAYSVDDRTVIRGGYGKFYVEGNVDNLGQTILFMVSTAPQVLFDGRLDFPSNPWNGPEPTLEQINATACDMNGARPGCRPREFTPEMIDPFFELPYSHQASIGLQRQLGSSLALQSDYVWTGGRLEETSRNVNLSYNAATGANYDYRDATRLPMPLFGRIQTATAGGRSNYQGLQSSLTKRMSQHWQLQATYAISRFKDARGLPSAYSIVNNRLTREPLGFALQPDFGGEYTLAATDQRHRAVFNGIWEGPVGIQFSGLYFYGSGQRYGTSYGGDLRNEGAGGEARLRPNGSIAPRNSIVGRPIHRMDVRVQKRLSLGSRRTVDGIFEVFNLFNRANYGSYTTQESNASFRQPTANSNIAYQPRSVQLGFRFAF